jgi:hypothetical protein
MRTRKEVALVQTLACEGLNHCQIARRTGIPRPTVRDWLTGKAPRRSYHRPGSCSVCGHERHDFAALPIPEYTYLLGIYLGDGCISTSAKGIHVLRLFQDMRYPDLIDAWAGSVQTVMPRNSVRVQWYVGGGNCASVISLSKSWPCLLPQHGPGRKHLRPIVLTSWQQELIDRDPRPLIAGLIHSDGCRVINRSMGRQYLRYLFTNVSADIRRIFCEACDQLGIPWRQPKEYVISIARREGVEALDSFIGPKS